MEKGLEVFHSSVVDANVSLEKRQEMLHYFEKSSNLAKRKRLDDDFEQVANAAEKQPNKVMRQHGVDHTPAVRGMIDFSKLKAHLHKSAIIEELELRSGDVAKTNWNDLRKSMRDVLGIPDGPVVFHPMTEALKSLVETFTPLV